MKRRVSAVIGALMASAGCLATVHPRPAEVARPGRFAWDMHLPLTTMGFGRIRADVRPVSPDDPAEQQTFDGPSLGMYDASGAGTGVFPVWWELSARYGLFPGCEVGAIVGIFRQGGEVRCALLGENRPVSLAVSGGVAYLPFFDLGGPWVRGGLDVSKRLSGVILMANLYASQGPAARDYGAAIPPDLWDPPLDETVSHDPGVSLRVVRDERRLAAAIGVGVLAGNTGYALIVGLAPYLVVRSDPIRSADCGRCPRVTVTDLDETFGLTLTVGVARLR